MSDDITSVMFPLMFTFIRTYNPNHQFSFNQFRNCIKNTANRELQKAFKDKHTPYYPTTKEITTYPSKRENLKLKQCPNYRS